jgi:hypothetical protein
MLDRRRPQTANSTRSTTSSTASSSTNQAPGIADEIARLRRENIPRDQWPEYLQAYARETDRAQQRQRREADEAADRARREAEAERVRRQFEDMMQDEPEEQHEQRTEPRSRAAERSAQYKRRRQAERDAKAIHDYLQRPIELEATNLYDFVKYYEKKKGGTRLDGYHFTQQHRQHQTHTIRKRALYAVPDLIGPRIPNRESIEAAAIVAQPRNEQMIAATNYYTITMLLFHSFRSIDTLAPVDNNRRQHEHDMDMDIDDELLPRTPINETEQQYRRWRSAFERWSKPAAVGELLDNAQLFYDSPRRIDRARRR